MLTGGEVTECPEFNLTKFRAGKASEKFAYQLNVCSGAIWPCGHKRAWRTTQTVNGIERCRECRRARWLTEFDKVVTRKRKENARRAKKRGDAAERAQEQIIDRQLRSKLLQAERRIAFLEKAAGDRGKHYPFKELLERVSDVFDLTPEILKGKSRAGDIVAARAVINMILHRRGLSYPRIGQLMGGRDHSTIINSVQKFNWYARRDPRVMDAYVDLGGD